MNDTAFKARVLVKHYEHDKHESLAWMPQGLDDAIAWLQKLRDDIPEDHRGTAEIVVETNFRGVDHYPKITIFFDRPPTEFEMQERIDRGLFLKEEAEKADRRCYELLKARFEGWEAK